jgi:hypothetical protein
MPAALIRISPFCMAIEMLQILGFQRRWGRIAH